MICSGKRRIFRRHIFNFASSLFALIFAFTCLSCEPQWNDENVSELTEALSSMYTFYPDSTGTDSCGFRYYKIGDEIESYELPWSFDIRPGYYVDGWRYLGNPSDGSTALPNNIQTDSLGNITHITVSPQPAYLAAAGWTARSDTPYKVQYYLETLDGGWSLYNEETLYGTTDGTTAAYAYSYPGFTAQPFSQETIQGNGSTVVEINYTRNTISYTFHLAGGSSAVVSEGSTKTGKYGESTGLDTPTKSGFRFCGWENSSGTIYTSLPTFGSSDDTFTATWTESEFEITFDSNGGDGYMYNQPITYGYGGVILDPCSFTKAHNIFIGWSTTPTGSVEYADEALFDLPPSSPGNVTLYAVWKSLTHTITFDPNGGTGSVPPQTVDYGDYTILPDGTSLSRTHYNFYAWSTDSAGSSLYDPGVYYSLQTDSDATLYAYWSPKLYKITFSANGGYGTMDEEYISYVNPGNLIWNTYTNSGYTFGGWNTNADGSGTSYAQAALFQPTSDTVLYAQWTPISYTITYDQNGGTGSMTSSSISYRTQAKLKTNAFTAPPDGTIFKGWSTSPSGPVEYADGAYYAMLTTGDKTLYAIWGH
ncbi:MAG: InlB B-repeat-containing protein [Treponema sp.]|nr:InlB B-repeat-containing protein [Treponema sp.]